jgi:gentisate 1,2-dioxygenase
MEGSASYDSVRQAWRDAQLVPLWESTEGRRDRSRPQPSFLWRWQELRPLAIEALGVSSTNIVERRALQLANPYGQGPEAENTTRTLAGAIQILQPGESARPHRHNMNALRFILEGSGVETVVNGKKCTMEVNDLVLTPANCWHEHHHRGDAPMMWLDVLDVPLHISLGTATHQSGPTNEYPQTFDERAFSVANFVPDTEVANSSHSPVFRYSYADAVAAVKAAPPAADGARRVRYANPLTGGPSMTLIDCYLHQIESRQPTNAFKTNANAICVVMDGEGETRVGEQTIAWERHDIFTLSAGNWISHMTKSAEARLVMISDREIMNRLGFLSEVYAKDCETVRSNG